MIKRSDDLPLSLELPRSLSVLLEMTDFEECAGVFKGVLLKMTDFEECAAGVFKGVSPTLYLPCRNVAVSEQESFLK